jgi:hypothetical protein
VTRARALAVAWAALLPSVALAAKTDVVTLRNGDHFTGEVKTLERGRLSLSTDDAGTLQIEWDKVASVSAAARFDVDDLDGRRYVGSLAPGDQAGEARIVAADGTTSVVALARIAVLRRIGTTFWDRVSGSVDAGASYASASELFKLDVAAHVEAELPKHELASDATATVDQQPDAEQTRRARLAFAYRKRFPHRWLAGGLGELEQNRELGFDLRSAVSAAGGRYLVQGPKQRLLAAAGVSVNREEPVDGEAGTNVELVASLLYDLVAYDSPKVDVSISARGFTSLSESGRHRIEVEFSLKREIIKDFYVSVRGYESHDTKPPSEAAKKNDLGVTLAIGLSF